MAGATYPVTVIAKLLDLTDRRVQQLTSEGVIPKTERGRYELVPAVRGYVRYLRDRSIGKDGAVTPDIASERARLTREQADKMAMENAKARGELIPTPLVQKSIERAFSAFGSRIDAIPRKAVPRLKGCSGDAAREKVLREMIREALHELSAFDFSGIIRSDGEGSPVGGNGAATPSGPDDQPVGGRVPRPVGGGKRGAGQVEHVAR
jgi:phage terminase Nu1 subunit (DNA packaging protein)